MIIFILLAVLAFAAYLVTALGLTNETLERELREAKTEKYRADIRSARLEREAETRKSQLNIATETLADIRDQNFGQATYEIWARKRAQDGLAYVYARRRGTL